MTDPLPGLAPLALPGGVTVYTRGLTRRDCDILRAAALDPDRSGWLVVGELIARTVVGPGGGRVFAGPDDLLALPAAAYDELAAECMRRAGLSY